MKNSYFIYGKHSALAVLTNQKRKIIEVLCSKDIFTEDKPIIEKFRYRITDNKELNKMLPNILHQGIAVKVESITIYDIKELDLSNPNYKIAILDQITDSHNIGAIIRSAAAFNINTIVLTSNNSPEENGVIAKTASGGLEAINFVKATNLQSVITYLKKHGFWVIGMDGDTETILSPKILSGKICLILGSEGEGMRQLTRKSCDIIAKIPISSEMESLNVSTAAAIAFFEMSKM
jgi:23S rRNA (guanosine2251-2'-O)-methyltransferase